MKFVNKNYYEILDIDPKASDEDVKRAYRLVRSTWTPDSIAIYSLYTPDESEAISHKIEEAFQILAQPERRASYDRYLRHASRLPASFSGPAEFWDLLHGFEPPDDEQELLDDVTDLLADPALEAEEKAEEVVLEATGGDVRGIERLMSGERSSFDQGEAIPDRDSAAERARAAARAQAQNAPAGPGRGGHAAASHVSSGHAALAHPAGGHPASARSNNGAARSSQPAREPRPAVPAAPAAPPVKGAPTWTPVASPRTTGGHRLENPPPPAREARSAPSTAAPAFKHGVSAPRTVPNPPDTEPRARQRAPGDQGRRHAPGPSESDSRVPVSAGWSRSYAGAMKPSRPLPDRPISPQMLAEAEADHGLGGDFLRMVREYKGITITDIAERTKIQSTYLKYLEEERFSDLPPAVYVEGFVTQVARLLKLDVDRVVQGYMARYELPANLPPDLDDF